MSTKERTEYQVRVAKGDGSGEIFVPNAIQSDVTVAVNIYRRELDSLMNRTQGNTVTIERHIVKTEITDYTETANELLKNAGYKF